MKIKSVFPKNLLGSFWQFILLAIVFGICYTQDPLYSKNQNTKFLYGLANAGLGFLKEDWLANTIDPLPFFSFLVTITYRYLSEHFFYVYYLMILGLYLYSGLGIVSLLYKIDRSKVKYFSYLALIIAIHCVHIKIFKFDTAFHLQSGVAVQYILGSVFQPSTFGVFLIFSIYAFLGKNDWLAVFALALAATVHPTYISSAAIITLSYLIIIYKEEGNLRRVLLIGAFASLLMLPVFSYMYLTFSSMSPEMWAQSQAILVKFRIPHHSIPKFWLEDSTAYVQTLIVFCAVYLVRKTRLFIIMLFPTFTATVLTIFQVFIDNNTVAFIAPWRFSVFLVPISTFIITGYLVSNIFEKFRHHLYKNKTLIFSLSLAIIFVLFTIGSVKQVEKLTKPDKIRPLIDFVKETRHSGETYLIPFNVLDVLGVTSENNIINLDKFRLSTGVPIFVNFKSHPYKDVEVIEWYKRILLAQRFYEAKDNSCDLLKDISNQYKLTHVVFQTSNFYSKCDSFKKLYENQYHVVYKINNE